MLLILGALPGIAALAAYAQVPEAVVCQKCHGNREFLARRVSTPQRAAALYVPDSILRDTQHGDIRCTDCHAGYGAGYPHQAEVPVVPCQTCHEQEGADWAASIHAVGEAVEDTPTCVGCHGSAHTVYDAEDRRSPTYPLNVAAMCGRCHADARIISTYFMAPEAAQARVAVPQYYQNVHGAALTRAGLVISATCNDCHRAHRVLPGDSSESSVNRSHIASTCGTCHVGVLETYEEGSAHGAAYRTARRSVEGYEAPACVDCHSAHQMVRADDPEWFLGISQKCATCHRHLWETYLGTYHGQVTDLGFGVTAKCSDCHTPHNMRPASDPGSSVYPLNLVATCARCHPGANENFVKYYTHGDPHDRERYPLLFWPWLLMTSLLVGVWGFFGMHSLLWFSGVAIERVRRRARTRGDRHDTRAGGTP